MKKEWGAWAYIHLVCTYALFQTDNSYVACMSLLTVDYKAFSKLFRSMKCMIHIDHNGCISVN